MISPDTPSFPRFLNNLAFDYKGSDKSVCYIDFRPPVGSLQRSSVFLSEGKLLATKKDGFKTVQLNGRQFGIANNGIIKRITIVPPATKNAGRFLADAIYVNDSPVRKVMNALFFKVEGGSPTGPLEFSQPRVAGAINAAPTGATQFGVVNPTGSAQNVWLTLGAGLPSCAIASPDLIPFASSGHNVTPVWQLPAGSLSNYFILPKGSHVLSNLTASSMQIQPAPDNIIRLC